MTAAIQWLGRDCKFVWRKSSNSGSSDIGSEPFGANSGAADPAIDYLVRIERPDGTVLRESYTPDNEYTYTYERNFEDTDGDPVRDFTLKVWARNVTALSLLPAQAAVSNPAPDVPGAIAAQAGADNITVSCSFPSDTDVAGMLIWRSTAGGFTPSAANLVYQGPNSTVALTGLAPNNQYFFRLAAFDTFGADKLNISNEFSATTAFNVTQLSVITQDLGDITAGSIRGVNVNASSHTTKGSYLTSALIGGEAVLSVRNTADFSAGGGSGVIIGTLNNRDAFSYTGKTATTLTGCAGVLAHDNGATIIPLSTVVVVDSSTNEVLIFGDRGDGTIVELLSLGQTDSGVGVKTNVRAGTAALTGYIPGWFESNNGAFALFAKEHGAGGFGISGQSTGANGVGVVGSSTNGVGGRFDACGTHGNLQLLSNGSSFPGPPQTNELVVVNDKLYWSGTGGAFFPLTMPYFESAPQAIPAGNTPITVAHGLTDGAGSARVPKLYRVVLRFVAAQANFAIGNEVDITTLMDGVSSPYQTWVSGTVVGYISGLGSVNVFDKVTNVRTAINANGRLVFYAW